MSDTNAPTIRAIIDAGPDALAGLLVAILLRLDALDGAQRPGGGDVSGDEWIPVTDRLPEPGTPVLAWCGGWPIVASLSRGESGTVWADDESVRAPVTHWMRLPDGPEDGQ